ncbi:MAG: amino acid ABC transporter substrate-binding protein [Caldilineae bacterium]|nr:MAG: amino acid ABC transporter substrate-binding protein [Caldilineae bacterium]
MSRKLLVLLAVVVLGVLIVAACTSAPTAAPPAETAGAAPATGAEPQEAAAKSTLDVVKERGKLICGVNNALPGFGFIQPDGSFAGFDIDFCRALSAAIFGDPDKVEYRPLTAKERFTALSAGEIDVLIRNTTWTLTRDTELAGNFVATTFYDGQGIQVPVDSGIETLQDLEGASICVQTGTTTELNLADQMAAAGVNYTPIVFETADDTTNAYLSGRCDAWTTDKSGLVSRQSIFDDPSAHKILDVTLSKEPLGPMVRHGDDQWFDIVQWVVFATFTGEEMGVTSQNVDDVKATTQDPNVKKLLGLEGEMGQKLGLSDDWAYNIIKYVGNYEEIYNRHLGPDTVFNLPRGLNKSWVDGGLLYAPPIR